jgi:hypothetical protein
MNTPKRLTISILVTGFIAGTLDIAAAAINFIISTGKNPVVVLNFIASGIFGKEAFGDNALMPLYGLLFHYFIALIWTAIFYFAYQQFRLQKFNWIALGIVYAMIVWSCMTQVVLPLSNTPPIPFHLDKALIAVTILIVCIGLPISYRAKKYF